MKQVVLGVAGMLSALALAGGRTDRVLADGWTADGRPVEMPHCWNVADACDGRDVPASWPFGSSSVKCPSYERKSVVYACALPDPKVGHRQFLKFEGASVKALVKVNGREVGRHVGAFTAFCFEVTEALTNRNNRLEVVVDNLIDDDVPPFGGDFVIYGGLYRDVRFIETEQVCIDPVTDGADGVALEPDPKTGEVVAHVRVLGGTNEIQRFSFPNPKLWSPEEPNLHEVKVEVHQKGCHDAITVPFGFRTVEFREDGFYLNGRKRRLRGVNRHQDKEGRGWALRPAEIEADFRLIKEMGADAVRHPHYPHNRRDYDACDRLGLLSWAELPNVDGVSASPAFRANLMTAARELVAQHRNHPSIFVWSVFNEIYNEWNAEEGLAEPILEEANSLLKKLDPTRPTTSATFILGRKRLNAVTDVLGWNLYPGWYGGAAEEMTNFLEKRFADTGRRIQAVSEYGAGGSAFQHGDPFTRTDPGSKWHPEEYQARCHWTNLKCMDARDDLWGTFVWVMFDFASDARHEGRRDGLNDKGLVEFDHRTKKDAYYLYQANWTQTPVLHLVGARMTETTNATMNVMGFSNLGKVALRVNGTVVAEQEPDGVKTVVFRDVALQAGRNLVELLAGGRTASAVWTYKAPSFLVEGAISAADRTVWRREVPGRLAAAEARLRELKQKIPAAFAGMEGTFQFERLTRRAELAERLLTFIGRQLEEVDDDALAYAMLGLRDFDLFAEYAEKEFACRRAYPLAPGVEHVELNVRDFGAKGDGQTCDSDAFAQALEAVRAQKGRPCVLKVPAGSYRLTRRMTFARPVKHPLTGEETGFAREEDTHLNVVAIRNFVLSGEDPQTTELVFDDYDTRGLSFFCCENATLRNIQLRWARTPFSQTTVLEVNRAENWAIVRHDPGTLRPDDACFRRTGISQICAQFDPKTHHEKLVGNPFFDPRLGVDDLGEGRFRIRFDPTKCPLTTDWIKVEVGAKLILPDRKSNLHAAGCPGSALCNFENVWVRNSREAGIMPAGGWMITASRCRTFPYREDLYLSTNADSFFNWRGSHLSGCFFHCMNDDGCNSYSRGALIAAVRTPDVLLVHGIAGRRRPGDLVQVVRPTDGRCMYLGRIREVGREKGEWRLRMESPVPTSLRTLETQHEKDMTAAQLTEIHHGVKAYENSPDILFLPHGAGFGYLCLGNDIGDLRNVGCQIQCPNTLVEGNRFSYVHTALELSSLLQWQEGTPPYDILYRSNVIERVGTGFGCGVGLMRGHQCVCSPLRGIAIVSNRFDDVRGVPLRIRNARDVQVFGNTFTNCPGKPLIQFSRNVRIHENEGLADLPLRSWRLQTRNASVIAEREFRGRRPVWRVDYTGTNETASGSVALAAYSPRQMLDAWIPPYVLRDAERISFEIFPLEGAAHVAFLGADLGFETLGKQAWRTITRSCGKDAFGLLRGLAFRMRGAGRANFLFAEMRIHLRDGRTYEVLHERAPRYTDMMAAPLATAPARPLPSRPRIQFGVANLTCLELAPQWPEIARFMAKYLPEYDIVLSAGGTPPLKLGEAMTNLPANLFLQFQKGQHDLRYAKLRDALVKNRFGESQPRMFNSTVATDPVLRDAYEDQIAYAGSLGFNNVQQYDYVWMYGKGGPWCFDKATLAAFREDLLGRDEGLHLGASDTEPARTIRFDAYFELAHGARVVPSDLGLADWTTYVPEWREGLHERLLYSLMAYEWLRQAQRFGAWSRKHCFGSPYDFLLNGEGEWNGNDHGMLPRLVDVGIVYDEHFDGTFENLPAIYRGAGCAIRNAARYGKHWGVCVETSRGGGGNQPYFSARGMYALGYVFAALGYDAIEYDGFPGSNFWHNDGSASAKRNARNMLAHMMACARGYRQARADGLSKARDFKALHVVERRFAGTHQRNCFYSMIPHGDLRTEIDAAAIDCEMIDVQELPLLIEKADVVFVSPHITRRDMLDLLARWKAGKPNRALVSKPEEVAPTAARLGLKRTQAPTETDGVLVLPFRRDVASAAVLVNRRGTAAAHAKMEAWFRDVWPVGLWTGPCDPAKVLFGDECPDCAVETVRVVAEKGTYRVYDFFEDRETVVEAKDGHLALPLGSKYVKLHYYAPDTPAFRAFLASVKADRPLSAEFLDVWERLP